MQGAKQKFQKAKKMIHMNVYSGFNYSSLIASIGEMIFETKDTWLFWVVSELKGTSLA